MLLTIDMGNSSIKLGVFDEDKQVAFACFPTKQDNYKSLIMSFLFKAGLREDSIDHAIFSCVVPALYDTVYQALYSLVGDKIDDINPYKDYGIKLAVPKPETVGDDIIVMCSYAYNLYHRELLIVSVGTCTVISHVTKDGEFKHCIIAPGFKKTAETLWHNAAQLPELEYKKLDTFLADNTEDAMNVGIYNGYLGMVEYLVKGIKGELIEQPYVIGCGGVGKLLKEHTDIFDTFEADFVTSGLNYIHKRYY